MHPKANSRAIEQAERRRQALALRLTGATFDQIGQQLGCDKSTAYRLISKEIREIPREEADELRTIECSRLDKLQHAVWQAAIQGDVNAVDRVLKISERRARLLGLDNMKIDASINVADVIRQQFETMVLDADSPEGDA